MKNVYSVYIGRIIIGIVTGFLVIGIASAIPHEEWNRTFGGKADDSATSVLQTTDGGYIVIGTYNNFFKNANRNTPISANNFNDAWIIKVNTNGITQWNKLLGEAITSEMFTSFQKIGDKGYIFSGSSNDRGENTDAWIVKTDASGTALVNKTFGGAEEDKANSIIQTSDGDYVIGGGYFAHENNGNINYNAWLFKIDSNFILQWSKTYGGLDEITAVLQKSDGSYMAAGKTYKTSESETDAYLIKIDANGNEQWKRTFGGTGDDTASSLLETSNGELIIAGNSRSNQDGRVDADAWLIKTDPSGNELWSKTFGGTKYDSVASIRETSDAGFIIIGYTESFGSGELDGWLIKTDSNGNKKWSKTFGGEKDDRIFSVQQISDGTYILAGQTYSYGNGSGDAWLIKVSDDETSSSLIEPTSAPMISSTTTIMVTAPLPNMTQIQNITNESTISFPVNKETTAIPGFLAFFLIIGLIVITFLEKSKY